MKRIDVDFSWDPPRFGRIAGALLMLAAASMVGAAIHLHDQARTEMQELMARQSRLVRAESAAGAAGAKDLHRELRGELHAAGAVIAKLNTPWDSLFGAVEDIRTEEAVLLSIEPDAEQRRVRLTGEARDLPSALEYVRRARATRVLRSAYLVQHQVVVQDPQRPVRFALEARWSDADDAPSARSGTATGDPSPGGGRGE